MLYENARKSQETVGYGRDDYKTQVVDNFSKELVSDRILVPLLPKYNG